MKLFIFVLQLLGGLGPIRICDNAVSRTNEFALRFLLGADTFGTTQGIDGEYHFAGRDRLVRTNRTARITCSAVFIDQKGHIDFSLALGGVRLLGETRQLFVAECAPQRGTKGTGKNRIRMALDRYLDLLANHSFLHGLDQAVIERKAAGHLDGSVQSTNRFQELGQPVRHGLVNALENI